MRDLSSLTRDQALTPCFEGKVLIVGLPGQSLDMPAGRDITLPTKVHLVKAMVFPVVMYGCESWTVKKAEC